MTVYTLLALLIFLLFGPLSAALLLWQRLTARRYVTAQPARPPFLSDVPDGNEDAL